MQELMSRHKAYGLTPRDCLKTTLFQKWQRMVAPPGECAPPDDEYADDQVTDGRKKRSVYGQGYFPVLEADLILCVALRIYWDDLNAGLLP